jgi:hypothetical protein
MRNCLCAVRAVCPSRVCMHAYVQNVSGRYVGLRRSVLYKQTTQEEELLRRTKKNPKTARSPSMHACCHHRNAVTSSQKSTGPTDSNSEQLRVRTAHRALLTNTTIRSHIVVWESVAMPIHVRRMYQACVMLRNNDISIPFVHQDHINIIHNSHSSPDSYNTAPD